MRIYITEFYNTQTAVQTFEQQFSRVLRKEIEPFHDDFIGAYKKLKHVSDDFGKEVKEIKSLKSSAQKFVEQIESKGIHIDELKENKVFSEEFFKSIDSVPQDQIRFFEDYYSRMNIAFQEILDRYSFNDFGRINIM